VQQPFDDWKEISIAKHQGGMYFLLVEIDSLYCGVENANHDIEVPEISMLCLS
jgi:hypothetical protein